MSAAAERRPGAGHTAELVVRVYPIGVPGRVVIEVLETGPEALTRAQQIATLRSAIEVLEGLPAGG